MSQRIDVIGCKTGAQRYAALPQQIHDAGGRWSTTECFDRCEQCERYVLARVDGAMMRHADAAGLVHAVRTLAGAGA